MSSFELFSPQFAKRREHISHRYCVNFIGCRSDDELNSRLPAWYTKCCRAKYLPIWPKIFISPQKVLHAHSGPLRGESALSLVFTVVLVTDVLLQLYHVSGTTYLPVCETRKSAAQNSEDNSKHLFDRVDWRRILLNRLEVWGRAS